MRLTNAGNLGIGVTNPSVALEVAGSAKLTGTNLSIVPSTGTNAAYLLTSNTGGGFFFGIDTSTGASFTGTAYGRFLYSGGAYPMVFLTNDTERMRIDSSGNLSVGITTKPSASGVGGIRVNGAVALGSSAATNSTTYTVGNDDYWITFYSLPGTSTITLPGAGTSTGRQLWLRTQSAQAVISATNNVTALATGSLGNGILPATQGAWALLISDGTFWNIVAANY